MFAELFADFGESLFLGVVQAQPLLVARIEACERGLQGADEKRVVTFAVRIGDGSGNARHILKSGTFWLVAIERFKAAASADAINVTLSENGAKPGFQRAAAVEITEEGALAAMAIFEAIEFRE